MRVTRAVSEQLEALEARGVWSLVKDTDAMREAAAHLADCQGALVGLNPRWFAASDLVPLLTRNGKSGFVVEDMTDVDEFIPVGFELPDTPLYLVRGVDRGDRFQNQSPEEVLPQLVAEGRRPLTVHEGLSWAITHPEVIEANACFMTISSRKAKGRTRAGDVVYDTRTPAIWNASGTGRDGRERKGAPKLGWCWWRNRHTWLGIASAAL